MERTEIPLEHGRLTVRVSGDRAEVGLNWSPSEPGLYRGYLAGPKNRTDLGILLPEGGCLRLSRSLSVSALTRRGCWPVTGGGAVLAHRFADSPPVPSRWSSLTSPDQLFPHDPVLDRALREVPRCSVCREQDGSFLLAMPWDPGRPYPLVPVFCFSRIKVRSGRPWVVFAFRQDGRPFLPQSCQEEKTELQ